MAGLLTDPVRQSGNARGESPPRSAASTARKAPPEKDPAYAAWPIVCLRIKKSLLTCPENTLFGQQSAIRKKVQKHVPKMAAKTI